MCFAAVPFAIFILVCLIRVLCDKRGSRSGFTCLNAMFHYLRQMKHLEQSTCNWFGIRSALGVFGSGAYRVENLENPCRRDIFCVARCAVIRVRHGKDLRRVLRLC